MVEVILFLLGFAGGTGSMYMYNAWVKQNAAEEAMARKRVQAQKTAEKRRTKAMKAAEQAQQAGNALGSQPNQADAQLYGRKANGEATWAS